MQNAHIIETALLLLLAFLIGCAIGWLVRTRFFGGATAPSAPAAAARTTPTARTETAQQPAATPAPEPASPVAPPAAEPATKTGEASKPATAKKPAAKKPAAKKATARKAGAKKPATVATTAAASAEAGKPEALSAPRAGGKDDLKRISGVGPKLEEKLNGLGIYHFDQIAGWDKQTIDWVDDHLSFKGRIERDNWVDQARTFSAE